MLVQPGSIVFDGEKNSYKVLDFIGNGSFGYVYKIERQSDNTVWALKTLPSNFPNSQELQSFQNESTMAVKVSHENAVNYVFVHGGDEYPELPPYIIMEYADGGTLQQVIKAQIAKGEFISNKDLLDYFHQLISGMEHINSILIHRDIKPDNILLHNGVVKISDFGLSKIVHDGTRQLTFKGFGHVRYMAPEGWKREKNTIQMDIYSMGITFYELATLQHPYTLAANAEFHDWVKAHQYTNPSVPKSINNGLTTTMVQVIMGMMEKSTTKRYKTWEEIRNHLLLDNEPSTENSAVVDNMIAIRLGKDNSARESQLKHQKEKQEKEDYLAIIDYQYTNEIYNPINDFINEFNKKYTGGQIKVTSGKSWGSTEASTKIQLVSGNTLTIQLKPLFDEDFVRDVRDDFFREVTHKRVVRPKLRDRKVLAWGYLQSNDRRGFNILLVENNDDLYGEWFILNNTNSALVPSTRPDPFPFEFEELEREIQLINALSRYQTEVLPLSMEKFQEYIIRYN